MAVHIRATKVRTRIAGIQPHIPNETRATTGKGTWYKAPIRLSISAIRKYRIPCEANDTTANEETEEANGDGLTGGETDTHYRGDGGPKRWCKHVRAP